MAWGLPTILLIKEAGKNVVVSQAGDCTGMQLLNIQNSKLKLQEKQAAAARQGLAAHA